MGAKVRDAYSALVRSQKSSKGAPAYSRFVNRPLGRRFAAVAFAAGLSPNQVTTISAVTTFAGISLIALAPPTTLSSFLVTVLLVLGYALDSADGQVARLRGGGTPAGEWLDHMVDSLKMAVIHVAVLVCWFRFYQLPDALLLIPILFQVISCVFFFGVILTELLRRAAVLQAPVTPEKPGKPTSTLYSIAVLPADYGLLCIVFLLLWAPVAFVPVYSALAIINGFILIASCVRWFRGVSELRSVK